MYESHAKHQNEKSEKLNTIACGAPLARCAVLLSDGMTRETHGHQHSHNANIRVEVLEHVAAHVAAAPHVRARDADPVLGRAVAHAAWISELKVQHRGQAGQHVRAVCSRLDSEHAANLRESQSPTPHISSAHAHAPTWGALGSGVSAGWAVLDMASVENDSTTKQSADGPCMHSADGHHGC
jgi:hypothetical protein